MRRRQSRSVRRRTSWLQGLALTQGAIFPVPAIGLSSSLTAYWVRVPSGAFDTINDKWVPEDWTVYRILSRVGVSIVNKIGGVPLDLTVGFGILAWDAISDTAPAALDTPLPLQGGWDWLLWWSQSLHVETPVIGQTFELNNFSDDALFNQSKAMRKLSTGTGLLGVVEGFAHTHGMDADWGYANFHRSAYKLP